jgi:hypothetical protein
MSMVDSQQPRSKQTDTNISPPKSQLPLEGTADLLENLPPEVCIEFTRRLHLSTTSSLPTCEASSRAIFKSSSYSQLSFAVQHGTRGRKACRLAYWNANGFRGKQLELKQFLSEHGVDICLLKETNF